MDQMIPSQWKLFGEGTKLNKIELTNGTLYIDLSEEFINENKEEEKLAVNSIIQTLSTLKEVNDIKILINGEELLVE